MKRGLLAVIAAALAAPAPADETYAYGRFRQVEPGVTVQRATEVAAEEALVNMPYLPGDRVWTDGYGRGEVQFASGTVVRLDRRSKLDYVAHDEGRDERIVLRLWSGSLLLRHSGEAGTVLIEVPGGIVSVPDRGVYRIDVDEEDTRLSVYEGGAFLESGGERASVGPGELTWARGGAPEPVQPFDREEADEFARWDAELEARMAWAPTRHRYLPPELAPYAPELESYGTWHFQAETGYVWRPYVAAGWRPYWNGNWTWTNWGWTWVPYESWGWAPFHYGSWGVSASLGWYWIPGRVWGPGWVSWATGGGYVGWCPLGRGGAPVVPYRTRRGHAVPRGSLHAADAWTVVPRSDLGRGDAARRRAPRLPVEGAELRVAGSAELRPTRDGLELRRIEAARPRAPAGAVRAAPPTSGRAAVVAPAPSFRRPRPGPSSAGATGAPATAPRVASPGRARTPGVRTPDRARPSTPAPAPRSARPRTEAAPTSAGDENGRRVLRRLFEPLFHPERPSTRERSDRGGRSDGAVASPRRQRDEGNRPPSSQGWSRPSSARGESPRAAPQRPESRAPRPSAPPRERANRASPRPRPEKE